jgi:hypothetical protein
VEPVSVALRVLLNTLVPSVGGDAGRVSDVSLAQLIEYTKKFIIIDGKNAIIYKEVFTLIKENKYG